MGTDYFIQSDLSLKLEKEKKGNQIESAGTSYFVQLSSETAVLENRLCNYMFVATKFSFCLDKLFLSRQKCSHNKHNFVMTSLVATGMLLS